MLKTLWIVLALGVLTFAMIGCTPQADTEANTADVSTGELPSRLKETNMDQAGGGGGGGAKTTEAPSTGPD